MYPKIDEVSPNGSSQTDNRLGPGYTAPIHGGAESGKVAPEWLASMTREEDPKKKKKNAYKRRPNEPAYEGTFDPKYSNLAILSIDSVLSGERPAVFLNEALPTPFAKRRRQSSLPRKLSMLHPTVKYNLDKRAKEKAYTRPEDVAKPAPIVTSKQPKPKVVIDRESKEKITVLTRDDHPEDIK